MKVTLTTRTPVHIGTGEKYYPNEYFATLAKNSDTRFISRIDQPKLFAAIGRDLADELIDAIDEDFKLTDFIRKNNIDGQSLRRYRAVNRSGEKDPGEIREAIKTADSPYIPGSSLKGAIRTALIWNAIRGDPSRFCRAIEEELERDREGRKKRFIGDSYLGSILSLRQDREGRRVDPQYDLLRFLQVADCMPSKHSLSVESVQTYSLKGSGFQMKTFTIFAECVNGTFHGSIGGLDQVKRVSGHRDYPLLKQKISLLGMERPDDISGCASHLSSVITEWSRWCFSRERALVEREMQDGVGGSFPDVSGWLDSGPHLRLGFGVGTLYQTFIGLIEEQDPGLAVDIINRYRLGRNPRAEGSEGVEPPYPKTFELTGTRKPLGWVSFQAGAE